MGVCFSVPQGHGSSVVCPSSCDLPGHNTMINTLINSQPIYTAQCVAVVCPGTTAPHPMWLFAAPADATVSAGPVCRAGPGALCGALQLLAGLELFFLSRERLLENARGWVALPRTRDSSALLQQLHSPDSVP